MTIQNKRSILLWGLGFVLLLGLAFSVSEYLARQWMPRTQTGFEIGAPFQLTDHTGQIVTEEIFTGRASAVFFGFTHCPEICPTTLNDLANARQALAEGREKLQIVFITLDPERDTVEVLKDFIPYFGEQVTGITGKPENVLSWPETGVFLGTHSDIWWRLYSRSYRHGLLLNEQGRMTGTIDIAEPPDVVEAKLKKLVTRL